MDEKKILHSRRTFRWSKEAKLLVRQYKQQSQPHTDGDQRTLITYLSEISGNPRDACLRFVRSLGALEKRSYRQWTKPEQQRLLDLVESMPVEDAAKVLRRPAGSVRSMLHRLGFGGRTGREWFTKYSLSRALRTRPDEIQKWIDRGWLRSRGLSSEGTRGNVIDPDDFCEFVKEHGREVVGRRLKYETLWFVQNYVFPPSHADLLSVRGTYKKRDTDRTDDSPKPGGACDKETPEPEDES